MRACLTLAAIAFAASSASCGRVGHLGSVSLAVTIDSDALVEQVVYEIAGTGLGELTGVIETAAPAKSFERFISPVPAGPRYVVHARARSLDGRLMCEGQTQFDVKANATTRVSLAFGCLSPDDGMVHISVSVACPSFKVTSLTVSPLAASVGSPIAIAASTSTLGADAEASTLAWSATTGTFASPNAPQTTYLCAVAGTSVLTITATSAPCRDAQSVTVSCLADSGADAP